MTIDDGEAESTIARVGQRGWVNEVIRTLVGLIHKAGTESGVETCTDCSAEEVLVDREVDGARYLLIRMPQPSWGPVSEELSIATRTGLVRMAISQIRTAPEPTARRQDYV